MARPIEDGRNVGEESAGGNEFEEESEVLGGLSLAASSGISAEVPQEGQEYQGAESCCCCNKAVH